MSIAPRNWFLFALLALLVAVDLGSREDVGPSRAIGALLPDLVGAEVGSVEIDAPEPDGTGRESIRLVRVVDDDRGWQIEGLHGFPVRPTLVQGFTRVLSGLTTLDLVSQDPEMHAEYGLDLEHAARVTLRTADGGALGDLLVGDRAPGVRTSYVRGFGDDSVFRAPGIVTRTPARASAWMDSRWLGWDRPEVVVDRIELSGSVVEGGPLVLTREAGTLGGWVDVTGARVAPSEVRGLLGSLSSLLVKDVLARGLDEAALGEVALDLTLIRGGGLSWRGRLGGTRPDGARVGTRGEGDWTVTIGGEAAAQVLGAARSLAR